MAAAGIAPRVIETVAPAEVLSVAVVEAGLLPVALEELGATSSRMEAIPPVSARLTTSDLISLNWRVQVAGQNLLAEARAWLERRGIIPEPG